VQESHKEAREEFQVERIAFFSDAVFAIAITLLVLEIKVPRIEPGSGEAGALRALLGEGVKILGFFLSFVVVGTYWAAHHRLFRWVKGYDRQLVWRDLWLLLGVSFIPFPTAFFSEYPAYRTPLVLYTVSLALVGIAQAGLVRHVQRHPQLRVADSAPELAQIHRRAWAVPCVCGLSIVLSFFSQVAARSILLAIPFAVRLFEGGLRRRLK
jgi:uncharacterized membrane protein